MPAILQLGLFVCLIIGITEIRSYWREGNTFVSLGFVLATVGTAWVWYYTATNW
jgi:hypothetical protein